MVVVNYCLGLRFVRGIWAPVAKVWGSSTTSAVGRGFSSNEDSEAVPAALVSSDATGSMIFLFHWIKYARHSIKSKSRHWVSPLEMN